MAPPPGATAAFFVARRTISIASFKLRLPQSIARRRLVKPSTRLRFRTSTENVKRSNHLYFFKYSHVPNCSSFKSFTVVCTAAPVAFGICPSPYIRLSGTNKPRSAKYCVAKSPIANRDKTTSRQTERTFRAYRRWCSIRHRQFLGTWTVDSSSYLASFSDFNSTPNLTLKSSVSPFSSSLLETGVRKCLLERHSIDEKGISHARA